MKPPPFSDNTPIVRREKRGANHVPAWHLIDADSYLPPTRSILSKGSAGVKLLAWYVPPIGMTFSTQAIVILCDVHRTQHGGCRIATRAVFQLRARAEGGNAASTNRSQNATALTLAHRLLSYWLIAVSWSFRWVGP